MRVPLTALLPLLLALAACGPGVEEGFLATDAITATDTDTDADTDADSDTDADTDSDTETDTEVWQDCPYEIYSDCTGSAPSLEVLLAADEIDPDVAWVAMGRNTLLAVRTVDEVAEPLIVLMDFDEYEGADSLGLASLPAPPTASINPLAVAGDLSADYFDYESMALVEEGGEYLLYGTNVTFEQVGDLYPVPNGVVPTAAELRGLLYLQQKVPEQDPQYQLVCAHGDGVFCFDGNAWTTVMPAGLGGPINDVGMPLVDERRMLVVGDDGFIARDSASGWVELDPGTTSDLLALSVDDELFVTAGRDGAWVWGGADYLHSCPVGDETVVTLSGIPDAEVSGVQLSGPIVLWTFGLADYGPRLCDTGVEQTGVIDSRIVGCDSSLNLFLLTAEALHGGHECVVVE